jgi:hypothetical protein
MLRCNQVDSLDSSTLVQKPMTDPVIAVRNFRYQHYTGNMADQLLHIKKDSHWSRN